MCIGFWFQGFLCHKNRKELRAKRHAIKFWFNNGNVNKLGQKEGKRKTEK